MKYSIVLLTFCIMISCQSKSPGPVYDLSGFATEKIGDGAQLVEYKDDKGFLVAQGTVINNVKNGAWLTYHPNSNNLKTITNYIHGKKNGTSLEFNDHGQIIARTDYKNDVLHGLVAKYKFGRPTEEITYHDGIMDGPFTMYNPNGKPQRSGSFKKGKQDGTLRYYDEDGNVTLEYVYKDGEKISGGIVEHN